MSIVVALVAAYGVHLLYSAVVLGLRGIGPGQGRRRRAGPSAAALTGSLARSVGVGASELVAVSLGAGVLAAVATWAVFGGVLAPLVSAGLGLLAPAAALRRRVAQRRQAATEAWPRLVEGVRVDAVTLGRSLPQALFDAGNHAPVGMRRAFDAARRTWLLSADFERSLEVLRAELADPTADAVCETMLVAHEVGGADVDRCLRALVDDRIDDLQGRRDALAEQAGARFARAFTLAVPLGMAAVGMGIGNGRAAYGSPVGQVLVAAGVVVMAVCWVWAGRVLRLPPERRVFTGSA